MSRVAVVTGGASGLGLSVCHHLARQGCRVGVLDINAEAAEKAAAELQADGAAAIGVGADVSDPAAVGASFGTVRDALGPVEILVTSAAVGGFTRFEKITLDEWNRFMAVNLTGTFLSVQAAIPDMVEAGWRPVAIIGIPVGFVGVEEAKRRLAAQTRVPYLTSVGRKGGSAVTAAAVNALAQSFCPPASG